MGTQRGAVAVALRRGSLPRGATLAVFGAGLISELVYLSLTVRLPWWWYGGMLRSWPQLLGDSWGTLATCLAGIGVLMAAYVLCWRLVAGEGEPPRRLVWGFVGVFALTLFWLQPITSDLFSYLSQAHLFTDLGANPLTDAVLDLTQDGAPLSVDDRLLLAYPTHYATSPSVYGPAWILLSAPGTAGTHDLIGGLLYLKGLASLAFLGCAGLIEQILKRIRPTFALEGLYLFAWNPLVLLMAIGDGHNDMLMMFIVLLSFWMLLRGSWALALGALTLSAWVKWISLIFLPLQLLCAAHQPANEHVSRVPSSRAGLWPVLVQGGLAALLVTVLVLVPFGPLDWVVGLGMRLLWPANWHPGAAGLLAWVLVLGLLGFTLIYVILILRLERRLRSASWPGSAEQALDAAFLVSLLAFLLGAARSQSWHLIWPATLAGLSKRRWAWPAVVGLSAVMLVSQMWIEWGAPGLKLVP